MSGFPDQPKSPYFLTILFLGCLVQVHILTEPSATYTGFMGAKWGASIEEVKKAIMMDGHQWFQSHTDKPLYIVYAAGIYLDTQAIFSYFFTPASEKLYRVDITFKELKIYERAKRDLIQKFNNPSYSQIGVDHWSWSDKSVVILQKDATPVQISHSSGSLLIQNQKEGGLIRQ